MKRSISYLNSVYYYIDVALFVDNLNLVIGPGKRNIRHKNFVCDCDPSPISYQEIIHINFKYKNIRTINGFGFR